MTAFGTRVNLMASDPEIDEATGGLARILPGIAIGAWADWGAFFDHPLHLAAIQHTTDGPLVGPILTDWTFPQFQVMDVVSWDGGVWVIVEDATSDNLELLFGWVTVDPATLVISLTWKFGVPVQWGWGGGGYAHPWVEKNWIVLGHNNGITGYGSGLQVIDATTGEVLHEVPSPARSATDARASFIRTISVDEAEERILLISDRREGSINGANVYLADLTDAGISSWTSVARYTTSNVRWAQAISLFGEWRVALMVVGAQIRWLSIPSPGGTPVTEGVMPSTSANSSAHFCSDLAHDAETNRVILTFTRYPGGWDTELVHQESEGADLAFVQQVIPGTTKLNMSELVRVAAVGAGQYLYLVGCQAPYFRPTPDAPEPHGYVTWAAGETVAVAGGMGQAEETRRAFRGVL